MHLKRYFWSLTLLYSFATYISFTVPTTLYAQASPEIKIELPQVKSSPDSVEVSIKENTSGQLVYTTYNENDPKYPSGLTLYNLGLPSSIEKAVTKIYEYQVQKTGMRILADPSFSPDGRYILLRFSDNSGGGLNWSLLYVFDIKTNQLKKISNRRINYDVATWSPDGNFIAFIEGGDSTASAYFEAGSQRMYMPLQLFMINWRTGQEYSVFKSDTLRGPLTWTGQHSLLFGALSPEDEKTIKKRATDTDTVDRSNSQQDKEPQPNIYEFTPEKAMPFLLFTDGYRPMPSPDGHNIAFWGSEETSKPNRLQTGWEDVPVGNSLSIAKRDGSQRRSLNRENSYYPAVYWLPDNRHLITAQEIEPSPNLRIQIRKWDIVTGKWDEIAVLQTKDFMEMRFHPAIQPFTIVGISQDGKSLIIRLSEYLGFKPGNRRILVSTTFQSVNLESGVISEIIRVTGSSGTDWSVAKTVMPAFDYRR